MKKTLYIFDYDGTLVEPFTTSILPGVKEWFSKLDASTMMLAITTNQGGVGLRYQMEQEGWGEPEKYPTEDGIYANLSQVRDELVYDKEVFMPIHVCFRYQSKRGIWCPTPYDATPEEVAAFAYNDKEPQAMLATPEDDLPLSWRKDRRKPAPGMLLDAMKDAVDATNFVMIGDGEEDAKAAAAAGVWFIHADTFFGR